MAKTCIITNGNENYLTLGTCDERSYLTFLECLTAPFVMKIKGIVT